MKNFLKRVLALALVLVMVSGYVPANVFAAEAAPALPTATVSKIRQADLTFALNFAADQITDEQLAYYGDWYADFELTVNKDVTFNANGGADGYLSGQYDAWSENWVNVPFENVTLNANEPLKIMAYAAESMGEPGLKYTYAEVYDAVKDFDCGIFLEPAFLAANPDLEVKLELKMYDPANETVGQTVGETYVYTIPTLPTATVAEIENDDLTFAMNFKADDVTAEQKAYYGEWFADFELTINKDVTFNANGGADGYLSGQYDAWSENWVNVPFENVTLKANEPLKIMAYAAESMGEPGLKYTYAEAYDAVKDFDCGVFFEDAFLAANPDLEVTLELKMYNPHDESINKVIGNTYTFKNEYVAYNVQTGKLYTKVSEATLDAVSGETVRLLKSTTDVLVNVLEGVTLDLDGHQLEANYVFSAGDVVDDSQGNTGVLKAPTAFVMLQLDNRQLPVNTAEGYKFYEVLAFNADNVNPNKENATKYAFQPKFEAAAHEALLAGNATSNVTIGVRVTWPNDQGGGSQLFTYSDEMVQAVLNSYQPASGRYSQMYTLLLNGTDAYPGLSCQGFVAFNAGSTNVEFTAGAQRVTVENQLTTEQVNLTNNAGATAVVPQGTKVDADAKTLTLKVTDMTESNSNISLEENEAQKSVDVHIEGVAEDNTVPMLVTVEKLAAAGLNEGNLKLYHVENGATNLMTRVMTLAEVDEHNEFYYDPITGNVTMALATFSEVAVVSDTTAAWEGNFDYSWYTKRTATNEYTIANADQLAAFGAIVGGMNGQTKDSFEGKTVKLLADINLGDEDNANESLIFHPVGYYYTDDKNADGTTGDYYSTVYSFEGTFDGNGHTVSNFYQNTWEIKGDYDGNYYDVAMGLFGYVVNGIVKNLTVDNFSSDGEFTPTGVIAAYAVNSTFENIAITNCNPRVYNTGNGGIVGIGGNSDDPDAYKLIFNNITIDNSNIISALWGSWDVACGGLVGMFRGAGHVYMTNCHVAAQMDVNNDVCGNYQYYWYRYSGMMVGTNKNMITDKDGYTIPETSKFHAENCTVHFGDWNDYYYCELVANSLASYTHDHQFSRLTQIQNISEIQDDNKNWTKTGNFILMNGKTPTETCYHIMKDANGNLYEHKHDVADATNPVVNETVNGETVLKENNQRIYLPFNQLFTGYGWGVKHIPVYNGENYAFKGITILDREVADSKVKFNKADTAKASYSTGTTVTIGELFKAAAIEDENLTIKGDKVQVTVSPVGEDSTAGGTYVANTTDWTQGTLTFTGTGAATITITDYYFCTPTTITVEITEKEAVKKFEVAFDHDPGTDGNQNYVDEYLYRVGNANAVTLGQLFEAVEGAELGTVAVTVDTITGASGTYTSKGDWTKGEIQFSGTGVVKVTITDNDYCKPTELILEVVDAKNITKAESATSNNVVLLNDTTGGFSVSGRHAFYGNGFTITLNPDSHSTLKGNGYAGYIHMNGGTIDNVRIEGPVFAESNIYQTQALHNGNGADDPADYYRNGICIDSGDAVIVNSYVSGARVPVLVKAGGNVTIENSRISGGAYANIEVLAATSLTLKNVTTEQVATKDSYGKNKDVIGIGIVLNSADTELILEGVTQYNWINQKQWSNMLGNYESSFPAVFTNNKYVNQRYTKDNITVVNSGIIYACDVKVDDAKITNDITGYKKIQVTAGGKEGVLYTKTWDTGESNILGDEADAPEYKPSTQNPVPPSVEFDYTSKNNEPEQNGSNEYCYYSTVSGKYLISFTEGDSKAWHYDILTLKKGATDVTYSVAVSGGAVVDNTSKTITFSKAGDYTVTYTYQDSYNYKLDNGEIKTYTETYYEYIYVTVFAVEPEADPSTFDFDGNGHKVVIANGVKYVMPNVNAKVDRQVTNGRVTNRAIGSTTIGGETIYYPIINQYKIGSAAGYYNYFPVFKGVTINDANGTKYDTGTTEKPEGLVVHGGFIITHKTDGTDTTGAEQENKTDIFKYSTGKTIKIKSVKGKDSGNIGLSYYPDSSFSGGTSARDEQTIVVKYCYTDSNGKDYYYYIGYYCASGSTGRESEPSCLAEGTLITMSDGSKRAVEDLRKGDSVLAFDHLTGEVVSNDVIIVVKTGGSFYKDTFVFDDGSELATINEHGIYDLDLKRYVNIDHANSVEFIGHRFVAVDAQGNIYVKKLVSVDSEYVDGYKYDIVTNQTLNYVAEDTLSVTHVLVNVINSFEFNDDMVYDKAKMQADIARYGLYTYDEWEKYCDISVFEQYNIPVMKVGISKGLYTKDYIIGLINTYVLDEGVQIN